MKDHGRGGRTRDPMKGAKTTRGPRWPDSPPASPISPPALRIAEWCRSSVNRPSARKSAGPGAPGNSAPLWKTKPIPTGRNERQVLQLQRVMVNPVQRRSWKTKPISGGNGASGANRGVAINAPGRHRGNLPPSSGRTEMGDICEYRLHLADKNGKKQGSTVLAVNPCGQSFVGCP